MVATVLLVCLYKECERASEVGTAVQDWSTNKQLVLRTMPLWLTVLILLLTRIEPIGLRERLLDPEPNFAIQFGYLFKFELSASLVVTISDFLNFDDSIEGRSGLSWDYELLYIPFVLPFVAASAATILVFRSSMPAGSSPLQPFRESFRRCALGPVLPPQPDSPAVNNLARSCV